MKRIDFTRFAELEYTGEEAINTPVSYTHLDVYKRQDHTKTLEIIEISRVLLLYTVLE